MKMEKIKETSKMTFNYLMRLLVEQWAVDNATFNFIIELYDPSISTIRYS